MAKVGQGVLLTDKALAGACPEQGSYRNKELARYGGTMRGDGTASIA